MFSSTKLLTYIQKCKDNNTYDYTEEDMVKYSIKHLN